MLQELPQHFPAFFAIRNHLKEQLGAMTNTNIKYTNMHVLVHSVGLKKY